MPTYSRTKKGPINAPTKHSDLKKNMGYINSPEKCHIHHGLPWNLKDKFAKYGIDVNDPKWGFVLDGSHHLKMHGKGYNNEWKTWLKNQGNNVTEEGALKFLKELRGKYGF